jgi:hypothetical protein
MWCGVNLATTKATKAGMKTESAVIELMKMLVQKSVVNRYN